MNKLFLIIGFLVPIPAYFNDSVAEYFQNIGGGLWFVFSDFGVSFYPIYLAIFILPIFLIIAFISAKLRSDLNYKIVFIKLIYGFIASGGLFLLFAFLAISQFKFTQ